MMYAVNRWHRSVTDRHALPGQGQVAAVTLQAGFLCFCLCCVFQEYLTNAISSKRTLVKENIIDKLELKRF